MVYDPNKGQYVNISAPGGGSNSTLVNYVNAGDWDSVYKTLATL
jgi:hypothetical protein